ncbi:hypothetical protein [Roseibium litorale]|uniref:Uncharacterized protein n=1 Tax=Roseibium litorale TaxID=2803841 RepID=A0ABR9CTE9_9HYPH|nr:hypothetical protein [Roseibium litorale]MBD8893562.1 hypothetical protein [Roseibium litorale]
MRKSVTAVLAGAFLSFALTAPAAQAGFLEDLFFAPTYNKLKIPQTTGTRYDCKAYPAGKPGWKGIIGGKTYDFDRTFNVSREGCFETKAECQTFLNYMSGYIDLAIYNRCQPL